MTFRARLLLFGCIFAASLNAQAESNHFEPFYFVLAADPHISKFNEDVPVRLTEMRQRVNALQPAFVIMAGDLLNESEPALFDKYKLNMREYQVPVYPIPGNHDIDPVAFPAATLQAYREKVGADHFRLTHNNCDFYFLNSVVMRDRATHGAEYDEQWDWLREGVAQSFGRTHVFFVAHHPPFLARVDEGGGDLGCCGNGYYNWPPMERSMLLTLLAAANGSIMFSGHFHRDRSVTHGGFTMHAPTGPQLDFDHTLAQQKLSWRIFKVLGSEVQSIKMVYGATDATPPSPPENLSAQRRNNGSIAVRCDPAADNTGVMFYDLYCNGERVGRSIQPLIHAPIEAVETTHHFSIRAVDPYGNESPHSSDLVFQDSPYDTGTLHWAEYR